MIDRCRSGDDRAFAALMDLYRHKIFALTRRVCARAPAEADDPAETARQREIQKAVGEALARLPVSHRMVVTLSDLRGLKNKAIADALSLSLPAVKSRMHRGRNTLKNELKLHKP